MLQSTRPDLETIILLVLQGRHRVTLGPTLRACTGRGHSTPGAGGVPAGRHGEQLSIHFSVFFWVFSQVLHASLLDPGPEGWRVAWFHLILGSRLWDSATCCSTLVACTRFPNAYLQCAPGSPP